MSKENMIHQKKIRSEGLSGEASLEFILVKMKGRKESCKSCKNNDCWEQICSPNRTSGNWA